jgi:protein SCO1/2
MRGSRLWIAGIAVLLVAVLAGCGSDGGTNDPGPTATPRPGTVLEPPKEIGDFTLTSHTGDPLSLSDLRGKVVLLFFGYTHCPDVCPMTLAEFKQVKRELGDAADRVAFVFASVDGERDTPERLAAYVGAFDPDFIGLTGDEAALREIGRDYGLFFQRTTYDNTQADYLVDHTASSFVVGPEGRLRIVYPYQTDPAIIAEGIADLLDEG